ncbi:MAG: ferritin-like domain-containing protein [Chloroflexota bacterium]|nr:MAG: ferritin-like domain-containing protein [Chloroflexota bacterium]
MATFNPFSEKGRPIEQQQHALKELAREPYNKREVDEYTRTRIIGAYGMENEMWYFYHNFARNTDDQEIKTALALIRRREDQHRSESGYCIDPTTTNAELTIAYEHLAVDLTAALAKDEPDPYVKQVFEYGLLEDFDHLFRFSVLLQRLENIDANDITRGLVEIKPGRPTWEEHLDPRDTLRKHYDARKADPLTRLHVMSLVAPEQQTRQFYASEGYWFKDDSARQLYAEIGQIEEQHVTQYESLMDPTLSLLEMAIGHEYNEIYNYFGYLQAEKDPQIKPMWEEHLADELEHLHIWTELYSRRERKDARQMWPEQLPKPIVLQPSKDYVNQVLFDQLNLRATGMQFVPKDRVPADWPSRRYQEEIDIGAAPSRGFQG